MDPHCPESQRCGSCKEVLPTSAFSPSYRGKRGTWCRACFAAYSRGERAIRSHAPLVCTWCQRPYVPKNRKRSAAFCSKRCKDTARNRSRQAVLDAAKGERACVWCADPIPQSMRSDAKFCSEDCNSAAHQVTRKMAKRAGVPRNPALVSRQEIADRDGWRCGLCGGRVSKDRRHPDPLCPSIDHVIPLARGGTNDPDNLQLAHLRCNLRKRALTHEKGDLLFLEPV